MRLPKERPSRGRKPGSDPRLLEKARGAALAAGLSEEEWEEALRLSERRGGSLADRLPTLLYLDDWTSH